MQEFCKRLQEAGIDRGQVLAAVIEQMTEADT